MLHLRLREAAEVRNLLDPAANLSALPSAEVDVCFPAAS